LRRPQLVAELTDGSDGRGAAYLHGLCRCSAPFLRSHFPEAVLSVSIP